MGPVEIVIIVLAVAIVVRFLISYIVRKVKGKPTGGCAGCPYAGQCGHEGACSKSKSQVKRYDNK